MSDHLYTPSRAVLCFESFKEVALYFDRVVPINMGRSRGTGTDLLMGYPEEIPSKVLGHLLTGKEGSLNDNGHASRMMHLGPLWVDFATQVKPYARLFGSSSRERLDDDPDLREQYEKLQMQYFRNAVAPGAIPVREAFRNYACSLGFERFSVALPSSCIESGENLDPCVTLSRLNLIDGNGADWLQILEVRKDDQSYRKLSRLRLFMHKNYSAQPFSYIEDDVLRIVEDYEQTTKKFGFKTTLSTLSMLLDAKNIHASLGAGLVAGIFGGPVIGAGAAACIEVGKIAVSIAEKRHEMNDWKAGHDLAYIFETKEKLS